MINSDKLQNLDKYKFLTSEDLIKKPAIIKIFEYSTLGKAFEKLAVVIKKNQDKRNKLLKTMTGTVEKYYKATNVLLFLYI